jgi:hypothetical protein
MAGCAPGYPLPGLVCRALSTRGTPPPGCPVCVVFLFVYLSRHLVGVFQLGNLAGAFLCGLPTPAQIGAHCHVGVIGQMVPARPQNSQRRALSCAKVCDMTQHPAHRPPIV